VLAEELTADVVVDRKDFLFPASAIPAEACHHGGHHL
jgi:hypothetical protein